MFSAWISAAMSTKIFLLLVWRVIFADLFPVSHWYGDKTLENQLFTISTEIQFRILTWAAPLSEDAGNCVKLIHMAHNKLFWRSR